MTTTPPTPSRLAQADANEGRKSLDLWMVAALSFLPMFALGFWSSPSDGRVAASIFVGGVAIHCVLRRRRGRRMAVAATTGMGLMPIIVLAMFFVHDLFSPRAMDDLFATLFWSSICGLIAGFIVVKQFEAAIVLYLQSRHIMRYGFRRRELPRSALERLDESTAPLAAPPLLGLPRQFSVRGMLIMTTLAAVVLGVLRACAADPSVYCSVMVFLAGTLGAQVVLFQGRHPFKASMWVGAFLLPIEVAVISVSFLAELWSGNTEELLWAIVGSCAWLVPGGIILGAVVGAVGGTMYLLADDFFLKLFRGLPTTALQPVSDADADVLIGWVYGPKMLHHWSSDQLTWPLTRQQLVDRVAAARESCDNRIYKAIDLRTGNMYGYAELRIIESARRVGHVEFAIVDTCASERGRLSLLLLRAIVEHAFRDLRVTSIFVVGDIHQPELVSCFDKVRQDYPSLHTLSRELPGAIAPQNGTSVLGFGEGSAR